MTDDRLHVEDGFWKTFEKHHKEMLSRRTRQHCGGFLDILSVNFGSASKPYILEINGPSTNNFQFKKLKIIILKDKNSKHLFTDLCGTRVLQDAGNRLGGIGA